MITSVVGWDTFVQKEVAESRGSSEIHTRFGTHDVTCCFGHLEIINKPVAVNEQRLWWLHARSDQERWPVKCVELQNVFAKNVNIGRPYSLRRKGKR